MSPVHLNQVFLPFFFFVTISHLGWDRITFHHRQWCSASIIHNIITDVLKKIFTLIFPLQIRRPGSCLTSRMVTVKVEPV